MNEITAEKNAVLLELCMDFIEKTEDFSVPIFFFRQPSYIKVISRLSRLERERHEGSSYVLNPIPFTL